MQMFVAVKQSAGWRVECLLNARKLTLEQQFFADDLESLSAADRRAVEGHVLSLRGGAPARS